FESDPQDKQEPERVALWEEYNNNEGFIDFAVSLGVIDGLRIVERSIWYNPARNDLRKDYLNGARETYTGINKDYSIEDLDKFLARTNINISKLVWNTLRKADPKVLTAYYCPNQQYILRIAPSSLVCTLKKY
ncbi:unnamed protein product, partial [marine sediment metagenome]